MLNVSSSLGPASALRVAWGRLTRASGCLLPRDQVFRFMLFAGALLRLLLAVATPLLYAPDESGHALYVREAAAGHLPVNTTDWLWGTRNGADEFFQPPLYYVLAGGLYRILAPAGSGALIGVRLLNVALGLLVAIVTWHLARAAFPGRPQVARWSGGIVALLPTFIGDSSSINNDVLCTLFVTGGTLVLVGCLRRGDIRWRDALTIAVLLGLSLWTKTSGLVLVPAVIAGGVVMRRRHRPGMLRAAAAVGGGIAIVLPWWIGRNWPAYGNPLAVGANYPTWTAPLSDRLNESLHRFFETFIAAFGRVYEIRPLTTLSYIAVYAAIGLVLLALWRSRRWRSGDRGLSFVLAVECIGVVVSAAWFALEAHQAQGRYLYYALPAIAILIALGAGELRSLVAPLRSMRAPLVGAALGLAYAGLTVAAAVQVFPSVQVVQRVGGVDYSQKLVTYDADTWVVMRSAPVTR